MSDFLRYFVSNKQSYINRVGKLSYNVTEGNTLHSFYKNNFIFFRNSPENKNILRTIFFKILVI